MLASFLRNSLAVAPTLSLTAGAVLLAFDATAQGKVFWFGVVLSLIGVVGSAIAGPKIGKIVREAREVQARSTERTRSLKSIMTLALRALLEDMAVDMSKARVSIYRHIDGRFILLARESGAQSLKVAGRSQYPDSEGVIGKAWDRGSMSATSLPESREEWNAYCVRKYAMPASTVANLKMQARSLLGMRIESASSDHSPVGLLMIESLAPRGVNGVNLDKLTSLPSWPLVQLVLQEIVQCLDDADVVV